jgi:O-methyltransferase
MGQRSTAQAPVTRVDVLSSVIPVKAPRVRRAVRPLRRMMEHIEEYLMAKGVLLRPLVPEEELYACQQNAIRVLLERDPDHAWGDYLEFGVFQGHTLSIMYRNLAEASLLERVRLYGFDSFEGYPPEALQELENGYLPGGDKAEVQAARRLLTRRGIDWNRVTLVKGWFGETLNQDFTEREMVTRVSLVTFDCDLYLSTAQALTFVAPLVQDSAIFFFDDWGPDEEVINQKRAFVEFLEANPKLHAEELPNYSWESRVFLITRHSGSASQWQERMKLQ